jgi:hypothetical protein
MGDPNWLPIRKAKDWYQLLFGQQKVKANAPLAVARRLVNCNEILKVGWGWMFES